MGNKAKYFVGSNCDTPDRIYFDLESAKNGEDSYIDVFDRYGNHIDAYKRVAGKEYTDKF